MDEYVHVVIHHGVFSGDDYELSYGGSVAKVKCDVDKWSYFEVLGIVKELGYDKSGTDGPIEDETENINKVVVNVDETEDMIEKLVEEVLNCKADGVRDINVDVNGAEGMSEGEVGDNNVDVNGAEDMSGGEVGDNHVDVNGVDDMSDSDDVSF
ncbi:hypothetical protein KIW84_032963 [Lathyrus oleraceus]|uniref:PB1-like domain-containing protein n=1 Tax=Pisum sativum TaxID=3888 RepID=A0A9D5B317_PEA|nr:hypothetical protein KIW84_032963 [Pisum sativum]